MRTVSATLHDLFQLAGLSDTARKVVFRRMGSPRRRYHGLQHLAVLWTRHRRFGIGTPFAAPHASRLIACTIAFHDVIYDPARRDNEHRSALLWRRVAPADLSRHDVDWVASTIEATADHLAPRATTTLQEKMRDWVLDLDLTPLGEAAHIFAHNTRALRTENRHFADTEWERRRIAFLRKLAVAPCLYRSQRLSAAFAAQAQRNFSRELDRQ